MNNFKDKVSKNIPKIVQVQNDRYFNDDLNFIMKYSRHTIKTDIIKHSVHQYRNKIQNQLNRKG